MAWYTYRCSRHTKQGWEVVEPRTVEDRDNCPLCPRCGRKMKRVISRTYFGNATKLKADREADR
jgi:predicted nucleic acid-binding Zn ribbon protein